MNWNSIEFSKTCGHFPHPIIIKAFGRHGESVPQDYLDDYGKDGESNNVCGTLRSVLSGLIERKEMILLTSLFLRDEQRKDSPHVNVINPEDKGMDR